MIDVVMKFPKLSQRLLEHQEQIKAEIVVAIQTNRGMLFDAEGSYNGHEPWDPLVLRTGQILARRGVLKKSIAPSSSSGKPGPGGYVSMDGKGVITVGTEVAYAAMMNFGTTKMPGGVLRPVRAKALAIPLPEGKWANDAARELRKTEGKKRVNNTGKLATSSVQNVIFRKWVKIPARRFDTITDQDAAEFAEAARNAIVEALR